MVRQKLSDIELLEKTFLHTDKFLSQKGQDKWVILEALRGLSGGYFLELAAADGIRHSNTYVLEKVFNWKGLCIEGNPRFIKDLSKNRRCIISECVISDKVEIVQFRVDAQQISGVVADDADNNFKIRGEQLESAEIVNIETRTLLDVLNEHGCPKVIDYLSLDIEGFEERVIKSFDFKKYKFRCITIERPSEVVNKTLFENGYMFIKNKNLDSFYVHPEEIVKFYIQTQKFSQIPKKDW